MFEPTITSPEEAEARFLTPFRHERPDAEREILARACCRFAVNVDRVALPAWAWGAGPTVLLLHGWEGRGGQLAEFVDPLVAAGRSVVAIDFPGHGDASDARLSVLDFARITGAVGTALGPVDGVVAHSMGAAATLLAQARAPFARRLVLIAPARGPRRFFDGFAAAAKLDDVTRQGAEERLRRRLGRKIDEIDTAASASLVPEPVLVVHDREDREVPFEHGAAIAAALPHAKLVPTDGLGHRRILKDPEVVRQVVAFLGGEGAARAETPPLRVDARPASGASASE